MAWLSIAALELGLALALLLATALWGCGPAGMPYDGGGSPQSSLVVPSAPVGQTAATSQNTTVSQTTTTPPVTAALGPRTPCLEADLDSVTDGDTIRVRLPGGPSERVRLIGIDAPERGQSFAAQATEELARILGRGPVFLEFDIEKRDQYGRLLAYVWVPASGPGGATGLVMANLELLRAGLAVLYTVPPNVAYGEELQRAQEEARTDERGIWGVAGTVVTKEGGS